MHEALHGAHVRALPQGASWAGALFSSLYLLTNVDTVRRRWKNALSNVKNQAEAGSNLYTATIHCINSGLRKLCRVQQVEQGLKLYRGFGDMSLPPEFFDADAQGYLGGVELGLMSTSPCREVAIGYSGVERGKALPTLFEIEVNKTAIGARISFLSQFESEEEYLFGPFTHLQVVGEPEVVVHEGQEMSVVRLQLTVRPIHSLSVHYLSIIAFSARDGALLCVF